MWPTLWLSALCITINVSLLAEPWSVQAEKLWANERWEPWPKGGLAPCQPSKAWGEFLWGRWEMVLPPLKRQEQCDRHLIGSQVWNWSQGTELWQSFSDHQKANLYFKNTTQQTRWIKGIKRPKSLVANSRSHWLLLQTSWKCKLTTTC